MNDPILLRLMRVFENSHFFVENYVLNIYKLPDVGPKLYETKIFEEN